MNASAGALLGVEDALETEDLAVVREKWMSCATLSAKLETEVSTSEDFGYVLGYLANLRR
jgi:hypothetical protein